MANRKITDLTELTTPASDDVLPIVDISETSNTTKNKKITVGNLIENLTDVDLKLANGTEAAPSLAFTSATSTGLYRSAANELSIATNGGQAIKVESNNKTTIYGDLVVTGGTTTISSTQIDVNDKNLQLATGNSSDSGADGGGLTVKGASDKTWNWVDSTDAWTANQHIDVTTGKAFKIAGTEVLNATTLGSGVVSSSLTSVGTLGSLTVTNAVTAGSLDISGGADIDGTLEADAYTVNGTALNEYIADTVGAMVSSNTETNIAVTYDDSDNTLDFVISSYPAASISGTTLASNVVTSSLTSVGTLGSLNVTNTVTANLFSGSGASLTALNADNISSGTLASARIEDSAITSAKIEDGAIVNADINASAAIAGTKISPDFGSQTIVTTGSASVSGDLDIAADIRHIGDTNTKISFGTDTINLRTGGASRLQCTDSGVDVIGNITVTGTVDGVDIAARNTLFGGLTSSSGVLTNGVTATTQSANDNSTKVATTAYTDTAISNLVDSSPSALNTLNELAAALGDDANFSTTVTNSIATKLPLAGGTLTGALTVNTGGTNVTSNFVSTDAYAWIQFKDNGTTDTAVMVGAQDNNLLLRSGSNVALTLDSSQNATFAGEVTAKRLTLSDDGATSPTFMLKTDDSSPWGFTIKNDTYSTSAAVGLKAYQANDGVFRLRLQGDSEYNSFYLQQHNGTSDRTILAFDTSGNATFAGDISLGDNDITNVGVISLDKIQPDGSNIVLNMATNKNISFSGGIGEIGSVTGFQALNDAGNALTSFGIRAVDMRFATGSAERLRVQDDKVMFYVDAKPNADNSKDLGASGARWQDVYGVNFHGSGASLTSLNASNLSSGTVATARLGSGTASSSVYLRGDGTWASVSAGSATSLDGLTSSQFLRSDADDTASGKISFTSSSDYPVNINGSDDAKIMLQGSNNPYIRWREGSTNKAYIQWNAGSGYLHIHNQEDNSQLKLSDSFTFTADGTNHHSIWHAGNDGAGSGLDADTLDGVQGSSFVRDDTSNTVAGGPWELNNSGTSNWAFRLYNPTGTNNYAYFCHGTHGLHLRNDSATNSTYLLEVTQSGANAFVVRGGDGLVTSGGNTMWHAGNDGAGSGLDADTLDGTQAAKFLSSYDRTTTTGWEDSNANFRINGGASGSVGLAMHTSNGTFGYQLYGSGGSQYGFLNGNWAGWDLKKVIDGQLQLRIGGTDYTVWNQQNDGSGSGLDADTLDGVQASSFLRSDASDSLTAGTLTVRDILFSSGFTLQRSSHQSGNLEGGHNNIGGTSTKTSPIYTIGANYNPAESSLSNMYGLGFSHTDASFITTTGPSGWGAYVAADGDARVFLCGSNGSIWSSNQHYVGSNVVWNAGNDGAGSGLDADTVDGIQAGAFVRADAEDSKDYALNINGGTGNGANDATLYVTADNNNDWGLVIDKYRSSASEYGAQIKVGSSASFALRILGNGSEVFRVRGSGAVTAQGSNTVWHQGNDGAGSGLDADLWDGNQFSSYLNQGVLNTSSPTFSNLYLNSWFRNNDSNEGLYNQSNTNHWYSSGSTYWSTTGSSGGIQCRAAHAGTLRGYFYYNSSNNIGILNNGGNWIIQCNSARDTLFHGHIYPSGSKNLGSTSQRWNNIYVNDLQLSNESKKDEGGNDVDGTWGDWTLQEGEENIFMINNRSGKKYKIALQEV